MATKTATRKQTEITSATVNRVISKATGKVLGYLVKSDTQEGVYYQVTWNREEHRYECSCPATKPCKHERAVSEVVKARKEIEAEKKAAVAEAERITTSQPAPQRYCDACSCVGKLQQVDGLQLCEVCAENTRPASVQTPTSVATKPAQPAKKAPTARGNTALGTGGSFKMVNGIPMR